MPTTVEELQRSYKRALTDLQELDAAIGSQPPTPEQEATYDKLLDGAKSLARQIDRAGAKQALDEFAGKSSGSVVAAYNREALPGEGNIPGVTADPYTGEMYAAEKSAWRALGEEKLKAIKSGTYLDALNGYMRAKALHGEDWRSYMGNYVKGDAWKVLNEGQDTAGGFWLPPDFRNQLITKLPTITAVRPNATVITTGTDTVTFPAVTYTTDDKYTSGVRFSWNSSASQAGDQNESTNPVAGVLKIPVHLATASIIVQREQMEDNGFDLYGFITNKMTEAFGLGAEDAYINGDGVGKPQGLLNHPSAAVADGSTTTVNGVTIQGGYVVTGVSGAVTWEGASFDEPTKGILGIEAALPPQYEVGAAWYGTKKTYAAIRGLKDSQNRPLWINTEGGNSYANFVKGLPAELLGYPVKKTQFLPELTTDTLSLLFGDMKGYYIVDRVALSVEVFRETLARRDQVLVYARMRTGGQLVDYWRMKFLKAGTS